MPTQPQLPTVKNGARFYKCALQVNPFAYVKRHGDPSPWADEAAYNTDLVAALKKEGIHVISVTDHFRVVDSKSLSNAARTAGIRVLPGFEAKSLEGVHVLCLFDEVVDSVALERYIGACGVPTDDAGSPNGTPPCLDLLELCVSKWKGIVVAAHVQQATGGLLQMLKGQARANAWKSPHLLAVAIPGERNGVDPNNRHIFENKDPAYERERPMTVINSGDISSPADVARRGAWTWIKMSSVGVEGLRQAFLDPESRVRLATDTPPARFSELLAIAWTGGFLDGQAIRFNKNLNVVIGGRGAGKSTVIESIRACLNAETRGEEAKKTHDSMLRDVLQTGTKIRLWVRTHQPTEEIYCIERVLNHPPTVIASDGSIDPRKPGDLIPGIDIFGQHEIAQIARSGERRTRLLSRFIAPSSEVANTKAQLRMRLASNRTEIVKVRVDLQDKEAQLSALPEIRATLKSYTQLGLQERLKERNLVLKEERAVDAVEESVKGISERIESLKEAAKLDRNSVSTEALKDLPHARTLESLDGVLARLGAAVERAALDALTAAQVATRELAEVTKQWQVQRDSVEERYQAILRELQKERIDGDAFIQLRRRIETLEPMEGAVAKQREQLRALEDARQAIVRDWVDLRGAEQRALAEAARSVAAKLRGRLKVTVKVDVQRASLSELLKANLQGRISEAIELLEKCEPLSTTQLADAIRSGAETIVQKYGIPAAQAAKLAQLPESARLQLTELDFGHSTTIELNVAGAAHPERWLPMERLSMGQKATAVLLLVLLESRAPMIIDQPEDDLDNHFLSDGIVPQIKVEKGRCQFIFTTHNANIPVLADAELIVGLTPQSDGSVGRSVISPDHRGSIDDELVKDLVKNLLEGGRTAFAMRRAKYGF